MTKAILFDFADTLATGHPCWEWPQIVACKEQGLEVSPDQVKDAIWRVWGPIEGCAHVEASCDETSYTVWIGAIEEAILRGLGLSRHLDLATRRVMELQSSPTSYQLFPETIGALITLREQGHRLALVSNNGWWLPDLVDGLGLAPFFDLIVTSARVGFRKPRPEVFAHTLATLGVSPEDALFVGDDYQNDVLGAQSAGLRAVLLDRKGRGPAGVEKIASLDELPRFVTQGKSSSA